jgi:DNA-binding NtrC family response regulator
MKDREHRKLMHLQNKITSEQGNAVKKFSGDRSSVQEYDWTGNIRELRNVVERLIILRIEISENDVKLASKKSILIRKWGVVNLVYACVYYYLKQDSQGIILK